MSLAGLLAWKISTPDFFVIPSVRSYFGSVLKGFFPVYAVAGLIGLGVRVARKEWTKEESILAVFLFGHAILVCSQIILNDGYLYVSARYLIPAIPLEFGWSVIGILFLWELLTGWIRKKYPELVTGAGYVAFISAVCVFLYDYYSPVIREYFILNREQQQYLATLHAIADTIAGDYKGPAEFRPEVDPDLYIPKYNPAVLYLKYREDKNCLLPDRSRITISTFLIRGRLTMSPKEADYMVELYHPQNQLPRGLTLLRKISYGKEEYRVWKKQL